MYYTYKQSLTAFMFYNFRQCGSSFVMVLCMNQTNQAMLHNQSNIHGNLMKSMRDDFGMRNKAARSIHNCFGYPCASLFPSFTNANNLVIIARSRTLLCLTHIRIPQSGTCVYGCRGLRTLRCLRQLCKIALPHNYT